MHVFLNQNLNAAGVVNLTTKGVKKISPFFIPYAITNMGGALLAIDQVRGAPVAAGRCCYGVLPAIECHC